MDKRHLLLLIVLLSFAPLSASADSTFSFSSDPQTIAANAASDAIIVSASAAVSQTTCILLASSSSSGQFSSGTNWNTVSVVTMSKNTSNRSFYYKDTTEGSYTITAKIAPKPDTVSASCASWSDAAANVQATITQSIAVGAGGQSGSQNQQQDTSDTSSSSSTGSSSSNQQATTQVTGSGGGSETLVATIKAQPVVMVGGGSFFVGSASDSHSAKDGTTRYLWNFGDGATAEGATVFHTYAYPGTYVVGLTAAWGDQAGMTRTMVQATPAQIGVVAEPDGSVQISNFASQEINIGLWSITSGTSTFALPQDTILLAGGSVQFSPAIMHMQAGSDIVVRYPNNTVVTAAVPHEISQPIVQAAAYAPSSAARPTSASAKISVQKAAPKQVAVGAVIAPTQAAAVADSSTSVSAWVWGLGALGLMLVAGGLASYQKLPELQRLLSRRTETSGDADEFDIQG